MQNYSSKEKILLNACRLFAQKGFKQTTIRDICKESGSYQISVNYYFGSKENLFKEALLKAFELTGLGKISDLIADIPNPEDQLREIVKMRVRLSFVDDERSWFFNIMGKEVYTSPLVMQEILPLTMEPHTEIIKDVLRKINPEADEFQLHYCLFFLMSQAFGIGLHSIPRLKLFHTVNPSAEDVDKLAETMSLFLIEGLKKSNTENNKNE
jgi:AcrR family transcriptional regulator